MLDMETKSLQAKEKAEVTSSAEHTRPGPTFVPAVDIFENEKELNLLADMPGVKASDLHIGIKENILTLSGYASPPEKSDETDILREYRVGKYFREFTLSEMIDQNKIEAQLKDGVLKLRLPKVESARPRKIEVKTN
ncbi:MAG: Hsp20/alpha crystallin family protein [Desulfobacteraceae bacterium]|nr:MAG: Hsp20/alpha crystallin family protein [Desulfobacteraceae bacterium]